MGAKEEALWIHTDPGLNPYSIRDWFWSPARCQISTFQLSSVSGGNLRTAAVDKVQSS